MRFATTLFVATCAGLILLAFPSTSRASDFDKLTLLTFDQPVSLPHVTLPAGTYRFELADPTDAPSVVKVMNEDGTTCYGMFMTIPENGIEPAASPVTLEKRRGLAQAITAWFYPGDEIGREFVYPPEERFRG